MDFRKNKKIMKKLVLILLLIFISAQDLTAQRKWQKEMLLQIAALKVYMEYAQKGYNVARKGLTFIGDLKKGELNLHSDYFNSLGKMNPKIKNYSKVAEIVLLQLKIIRISNKTIKQLQSDDLFAGNELQYIERSFERLFDNCNQTLEELLLVTTDATLEMKDDQRLARIDLLYKTMMQDYTFCKSFSQQSLLLGIAKARDKNEVKQQRELQGL